MCFATYFLHIRSFFSYPPSPVWNGSCPTASRVGLCCQNLSMSGGERPHIRYTIYGTSVHNRSSCCQVPFRLDLSSKNSSFRPLTRKIGNSPISTKKARWRKGVESFQPSHFYCIGGDLFRHRSRVLERRGLFDLIDVIKLYSIFKHLKFHRQCAVARHPFIECTVFG